MSQKTIIYIAVITLLLIPFVAYSADKIVVKDSQGVTKFLVNDQGRVGIGTTTPQAQIDVGGGEITVNGSDTSAGTGSGTRRPGLSWGETGRINIGWGGAGGGNLEAYSQGHPTRAGRFYFVYGGGDFGDVRFIHYDGATWEHHVIITKDGYIGIGTEYPNHPIHLGGGAYTDGYDWYPASSREYKENIESLTTEEAINALEGLNPVKFNFKAEKNDRHLGFIAEDVPDLVATKDRKGLSPMEIVAVLTGVVKEQQRIIEELKEELKEVKRELRLKESVAQAEIE